MFQTLKTVLSLALMLMLAIIMVGSKAGDTQNEDMVKENIEVKAVTIMIATPDEILSALTDPAQRQ